MPACPDDFTVYRELADVDIWGLPGCPTAGELGKKVRKTTCEDPVWSYSDEVCFCWRCNAPTGISVVGDEQCYEVLEARSMICLTNLRRNLSITLRVNGKPLFYVTAKPGFRGKPEVCRGYKAGGETGAFGQFEPQWPAPVIGEISGKEILEARPDGGRWLSLEDVADALFAAIFRNTDEPPAEEAAAPVIKSGLIVVSGQTGTGKSTILRLLIKKYLKLFDHDAWGKSRYPHVITLEDPIEDPIQKEILNNQPPAKDTPFNFTPRHLGFDATDKEEGFLHALRQTPAAVVVGEIRDKNDWKRVLNFAATGHLCITTTHAGSLVESMRKIIEATKASTPDLRSSLAEKIAAVVHLRQFSLKKRWGQDENPFHGTEKASSILLPAIWRNSHGGSNFFVSDGLSAILPRRRALSGTPMSSCRGRADFLESLLAARRTYRTDLPAEIRHVQRIALKADLEGV